MRRRAGCRKPEENSAERAFVAALALILALAACAPGRAGGAMTAEEAQRILAEQGYAGLHDLRPMAGGFAAEATRDGRTVSVVIDADGIIHTQ